jgi:hypothetical protein
MYNYEKEFFEAVQQTKLLGFNINIAKFNTQRYFSEVNISTLSKKINDQLDNIPNDKYPLGYKNFGIVNSIVANCGPFHYFTKKAIEKFCTCNVYLTLGYISFDNKDFFHKITRDDLNNALKTQNFPSQHHVWLTLESGEILDLTFGLTYRYINDQESIKEDLKTGVPLYPIMNHPTKLMHDMQYHPIAVGKEVLLKAGYQIELLSDILYS